MLGLTFFLSIQAIRSNECVVCFSSYVCEVFHCFLVSSFSYITLS